MTFKIRALPMGRAGWRAGLLLIGMSVVPAGAHADPQDIILNPCNNITTSYAATTGQVVNEDIEISASGNVFWSVAAGAGCTTVSSTAVRCGGMTLTIPDPDVPAPNTSQALIAGTATSGGGTVIVTVTLESDPTVTCNGTYLLHVTADGGGWGDPHLTTVDGVKYDFQSAGEFTALRQDGFEVQTRQAAVPTTSIPSANPYTGLATCVAIYTAAAVRIGPHRVTVQPHISGRPDPSSMQLRVDGQLVKLTASGINLGPGGGGLATATPSQGIEGRIVPLSGGGIQITDWRGTQVVVTPAYWQAKQTWYLNVNIYLTSATEGTMGRLAPRSWLPALPDGTSLGPKPDSLKERYQQLYEQFADAWRVTDATSLFDYAPGTSTATFTIDEWPRFSPQSCALEGQTPVQPTTPEIAAQACAGITDANRRADCVFDVTFTGHTGFASSYQAMQRIEPPKPGWQPGLPPEDGGRRFKWWWILVLIAAAAIAAAAGGLVP